MLLSMLTSKCAFVVSVQDFFIENVDYLTRQREALEKSFFRSIFVDNARIYSQLLDFKYLTILNNKDYLQLFNKQLRQITSNIVINKQKATRVTDNKKCQQEIKEYLNNINNICVADFGCEHIKINKVTTKILWQAADAVSDGEKYQYELIFEPQKYIRPSLYSNFLLRQSHHFSWNIKELSENKNSFFHNFKKNMPLSSIRKESCDLCPHSFFSYMNRLGIVLGLKKLDKILATTTEKIQKEIDRFATTSSGQTIKLIQNI